MRRRRRIKRWLAAWKRLIEFGKMLQDLHEHGLGLAIYLTEGSPVTAQARMPLAAAEHSGAVIPIHRVKGDS